MADKELEDRKKHFLNMPIRSDDFSVRSYNRLRSNNVNTVGNLLELTSEDIYRMRGMGKKSADEVLSKIEDFQKQLNSLSEFQKNDISDFKIWMDTEERSGELKSYLKKQGTTIDALENLSARAYNLLTMNGANYLYMLVGKNASEIKETFRMDNTTAAEISTRVKKYILENQKEYETVLSISLPEKTKNDINSFDIYAYQDQIIDFFQHNDYKLQDLGLSNRAQHVLNEAGYEKISEIILFNEEKLKTLPASGNKTAHEIKLLCSGILNKNMERIKAYCLSNKEALIDDGNIHDQVLLIFRNQMNDGFKYDEIREMISLPASNKLKHILGRMISSGEIVYVDGYCYRVYGKFADYYKLCQDISERDKKILENRLNGNTLEKIGAEYGITRERARQILKTTIKRIKSWYFTTTGMRWFDEDYFSYLFENYQFSIKERHWFGISEETYRYLDMSYKNGKEDLEEALSDPQVDLSLKLKIRVFLNRKKLRIGNDWINHRRPDLIEYYIRKYCHDQIQVSKFIEDYNNFCKKMNYSDDLLIKSKHSLENFLNVSHFVLKSQNFIFRFYDIDSHDYTDLIEGIGLKDYENTEVSTLKFMEDYPKLMEKYDIHDQYELHNLLKRTVKEGSYNNIHFRRMPTILFGEFDRNTAIVNLIRDNSPIKLDDLINMVHEKYGYDKSTMAASIPQSFAKYCYKNVYTVPDIILSDDRIENLKKSLTKDFYYVNEIRTIYTDLYPNAGPDDISAYNLKRIGFNVYSNYAIQHFENAKSYFEYILTKDEKFDFGPYRRRFGYIQTFYNAVERMKENLQLIEYEPDQMIQLKCIEKTGFSKNDFLKYRDAIWQYVADDRFFTINSIKKTGFKNHLDDLGFENWFYADVLSGDTRFNSSRMLQNIVFNKEKEVTLSTFIASIVWQNDNGDGIDRYDLLEILTEKYGCAEPDRYKLNEVLKSAGIYYDEVLDRFYSNEDTYLSDIDAGE